jgi:hypothetical protein
LHIVVIDIEVEESKKEGRRRRRRKNRMECTIGRSYVFTTTNKLFLEIPNLLFLENLYNLLFIDFGVM